MLFSMPLPRQSVQVSVVLKEEQFAITKYYIRKAKKARKNAKQKRNQA